MCPQNELFEASSAVPNLPRGPIETRTAKLIPLDKNLFRPRGGSFSSPKIVRANPRSAVLLAVGPKSRMSSSVLTSPSPYCSIGPCCDIEKIYKTGDFRRRVSASILLDNLCNRMAPEKLAMVIPDAKLLPVCRSLSFNHVSALLPKGPAKPVLSGVLKNVRRELSSVCCEAGNCGDASVKVT